MTLFQNSVLRNHLKNIDKNAIIRAFDIYQKEFLPKIANIRSSKEEQYQYGFLDDLFVKVLGYTLNPTPNYNLIAEQKNLSDSKKADGAVLKDGKVIAVIELKSTKTKSMDKIVNQAFSYKHNHPTCKYIITSNFQKLRFYVEHSDKYEEFNLFDLDEERFTLLYVLLSKENIFSDVPLKLKEQSKLQEENISNELYKKYAELRTNLFDNIIQNNLEVDKYILLEKTQTILDRMVFIFFAEDRGILPPNTIQAIIDHYKDDIEDRELWHFYKIYFKAINIGNKKLNIPEYNGGLFAIDELLNSLKIDNDVIEACPLALSAYDFNSDIDVNILGHIFENSLNDIEELKARIDDADFDAKLSKRKKDGVFYTPEYITKYIVDNTLGSLCQAKKEELGLDEVDIHLPKNPKKLNKGETKQKEALEAYREYLLGLKILDPACGSGAFLNQALNYLLEEHAFIDESVKTLMGGSVLGLYDVKKGILENNLYGVDINAEAVEIAKLSLWLRTVESGRKLNKLADKIKVGNSLIDDKSVADDAFVWEEEFAEVIEQGGFDVVIGNPPYVVYRKSNIGVKTLSYVNEKYTYAEYNPNTYALFTDIAINELLKPSGYLGYIIPNSWLKNKYFKNMRQGIYSCKTKEIVDLKDSAFNEVVETVILILTNENYTKTPIKFISNLGKNQFITKSIVLDQYIEGYNPFENNNNPLIEKIKLESFSLKDYAVVYRGLETRNNTEWLSLEKKDGNYIPILLGKDINKYALSYSGTYVNFIKREMKSNANEKMYLQPKILMRRTGSYVIATIDMDNYFALKNLYLIIPKDDSQISLLLMILNSKLMDFYHKSINSEENKAFAQFKGSYVQDFPIPKNLQSSESFDNIVKLMLELNKTFQTKKIKFLNRVKDNFDLDKLSKKLEAFYETDFKTFLKELKKKKVTLTLKDQDKWEEYFESYQKELLEIQAQIDTTDKQIDEMVYELYGLSEDEIRVVEGKDLV